MSKLTEILHKYTAGELTIEQTNVELKLHRTGIVLDPDKNKLTAEDIANGYGLLDTGTGTMDKVQAKDGKLVGCNMGGMFALFIQGGKTYEVNGADLIEQ